VRRLAARGDPPVVLSGLGDPIRSSATSGLLGGAVARLAGVRAGASGDDNRAALAARVARHVVHDRERTTWFLGELCGLAAPPDAPPELVVARRDPRVMADRIAQAWLGFVRAEAAAPPVLLILDDLQWSDALTVSLVDVALRELTSSPLMVLALGRCACWPTSSRGRDAAALRVDRGAPLGR